MASASVYQVIATLSGEGRKSVTNVSEQKALDIVSEFVRDGTLTTRWGVEKTRQALELRVYRTAQKYNKTSGQTLDDFVKRKKNVFSQLETRVLQEHTPPPRVFVIMPIQGDRYGSQSEQNVLREYDGRFTAIESTLQDFGCVAIRIDKEQELGDLPRRIKREIARAQFVVADLTDERPSCYFEAGYADALATPVIFVASRESVVNPGEETTIHFDIHQNVRFFTNSDQLQEELKAAIEMNREQLLERPDSDEEAESAARVARRLVRSSS